MVQSGGLRVTVKDSRVGETDMLMAMSNMRALLHTPPCMDSSGTLFIRKSTGPKHRSSSLPRGLVYLTGSGSSGSRPSSSTSATSVAATLRKPESSACLGLLANRFPDAPPPPLAALLLSALGVWAPRSGSGVC